MQELYTDQSYLDIHRQLNRRFALMAAVLAVFFGLFLWAMIARIQWLAMVSACVGGCFAVFFTGLFCMPLVRYRRLVRAALSGRNHEKTMEFVRVEPDPSVVDGVACRSLIFLGDPDKHGSREMLLYWDEELPLPVLNPGKVYTVRYTGKNIIGIQSEAA
jgi:hypothetical protein